MNQESKKRIYTKAGIRAKLRALKLAARQRFRPRVVTIGGVRVPRDPAMIPDEVIALIYQERWEAEARLCREALRPGDRVLEIGAGTGFIGSLCARICGSENVLSYEANPRLEPLIRRTYALNGVSPTLRMRAIAAASACMGKNTIATPVRSGSSATSTSCSSAQD